MNDLRKFLENETDATVDRWLKAVWTNGMVFIICAAISWVPLIVLITWGAKHFWEVLP